MIISHWQQPSTFFSYHKNQHNVLQQPAASINLLLF
jgi:hypothetical protein